jgi:hypothetical protein
MSGMPTAMCSICGGIMHLNVGDHAAWYAERHPDAPFGAIVPEPCPFCFAEVAKDDTVVTRRLINQNVTIEAGERGVVEAVYTNAEFGRIYQVRLDSGKTLCLPRAAIRKPFSNELDKAR